MQERPVAVEEVADADELFCTVRSWLATQLQCATDARVQGTAVVVVPVGSVMHKGAKTVYKAR